MDHAHAAPLDRITPLTPERRPPGNTTLLAQLATVAATAVSVVSAIHWVLA